MPAVVAAHSARYEAAAEVAQGVHAEVDAVGLEASVIAFAKAVGEL